MQAIVPKSAELIQAIFERKQVFQKGCYQDLLHSWRSEVVNIIGRPIIIVKVVLTGSEQLES